MTLRIYNTSNKLILTLIEPTETEIQQYKSKFKNYKFKLEGE